MFYNPNVRIYDYDLEKGKQLLAEAGFKDHDGDGIIEKPKGVPVKFTLVTNSNNNERVQMCQIITKDLRLLGLDVSFSPLQFNTFVSKLQATLDWEVMVLALTGGTEPNN